MGRSFTYLMSEIPKFPVHGAYLTDLGDAVASAAFLFTVLLIVYLIVRATYLVIRLFTEAAVYLTMVMFVVVILIGWVNR